MKAAIVVLHVAAILAAHGKEGIGDLAEGACFGRFHEGGEQVAILHGDLLQLAERGRGRVLIPPLKSMQLRNLELLFLFRRPNHLTGRHSRRPIIG